MTSGSALAEEIPALVEGDLDGSEPFEIGLRKRLTGVRPFELVLFVGQLVDSSHDVQVVHPTILARIGCYDGQAERAIAWALLTLMASVGVLIAVVIYLAMGDRAANVLGDLKTWMAATTRPSWPF